MEPSVYERNRIYGNAPFTNTYLKSVYYGNKIAYYPDRNIPQAPDDFLFELVVDYGEHATTNPQPDDAGDWLRRDDPYSNYRSGFRT